MSPAKEEDDPVVAEYDVYITPDMAEQVFLLSYPNRARAKPYTQKNGHSPIEFRIKPKTGYIETDVKTNTDVHYNKYKGLKWADATAAAKELHNSTATFGPASGLTQARPRNAKRDSVLKDSAAREQELDKDLHDFRKAKNENKVLTKITMGGQLFRDTDEDHSTPTANYVGAFEGNKLHLTKIAGAAQMRQQFHHVDAEAERTRLAASRTQYDGESQAPVFHRNIKQQTQSKQERDTTESRMKRALSSAEQEKWETYRYVDEDEDESFATFKDKFFLKDTDNAPKLKMATNKSEYLQEISGRRPGKSDRRRNRPLKIKDDNKDANKTRTEA